MKIKNIVIEVKSIEDTLKEAKRIMERLEKGKAVEKKDSLSFKNVDIMRKVLTNKRLQLIKAIRKYKPQSIYELAKIVGRNPKSVNIDVMVLNKLGMMDLKRTDKKRENIVPKVNYKKIDISIAV